MNAHCPRAGTTFRGRLVLGLAAGLALVACSSPPPQAPTAAAQPVSTAPPPPPVAPPQAMSANPAAVAPNDANRGAALPSASAAPGEASIFFAFDEYVIASEYLPTIEKLGRYLSAAPAAVLRVEGHADERGSHEYNLALGQKRAEAVVRALRTYGVRDNQVEAVSFGEERPRAEGHEEASWSQNRRADLRPAAKP
ncbi:MAG: OmpA family protein [Burkholderiales bacterium]|nr:OmpA family protein [Burkholderiales bacterium]